MEHGYNEHFQVLFFYRVVCKYVCELQNGVTVNGVSAIVNGAENTNSRTCRYRNRREIKSADHSSETESETDSSEIPRVTTRRAWSDYCTNKGRSSQSEDETSPPVCIGQYNYFRLCAALKF